VPCRRSLVPESLRVLLVEMLVLGLARDLLEDLPFLSYVMVDPLASWELKVAHPVHSQVVDPWTCQAYLVSVSIARHLLRLV
jgi:hypothetical protein